MIKGIKQMKSKIYLAVVACIVLMVCLSGCEQLTRENNMEPEAAPTDFSGELNYDNGEISLTWSNVRGVTSYEIFSSTDPNSSNASKVGSTSETTFVRYLASGVLYFWVKARNGTVASDFSEMLTIGLSAPTGLAATSSYYGEVFLTWDVVDDATSYELFYSTDNDSSNATSMFSTDMLAVEIYNINISGVLYFWIKAKNNTVTSDFSDEVSVTVATYFKIGGIGPGGGVVFRIAGDTVFECSANLGTATWSDAFILAKNHRGDGYDDWYLPNKTELNYIYENLRVPNHISDDGMHWSSSEYDLNYAWVQHFGSGTQVNVSKTFNYSVRAIRAFNPSTL